MAVVIGVVVTTVQGNVEEVIVIVFPLELVTVPPEPKTFILLATGIAGLPGPLSVMNEVGTSEGRLESLGGTNIWLILSPSRHKEH